MSKMRVESPGMPGWEPMEQREQSRTCSDFSESWQRKAKPIFAVAHLGGDVDFPPLALAQEIRELVQYVLFFTDHIIIEVYKVTKSPLVTHKYSIFFEFKEGNRVVVRKKSAPQLDRAKRGADEKWGKQSLSGIWHTARTYFTVSATEPLRQLHTP